MRRLVIGLFVAVVVGVLFVVLCTYVKRPYETVLLNRFMPRRACAARRRSQSTS